MEIEITADCECEYGKHETKNYPREGIVTQAFKAGTRFELIDSWANFYGSYYRVKTDKGYADISTENANPIP